MSTSGGHDAVEDPTTQGGGRQRTPWPVWAWALWDWGSAAFNAVITTFVFSVYITDPDIFGDDASSKLGWALAGAGVLIAVLAPVLGQGADRSGRRTFWLAINTYLVVLTSAGLFLVRPEAQYLWLGLVLLAVGNVFFEIASVNYNAMLNTISTKDNVGRISGLGWGLGYLGGIVLLTIVVVGFVNPDSWFGIENDDALGVRLAMLLCAVWTLVFSLPVIRTIRDDPAARGRREPGAGVVGAYRLLFASIARLWRSDRTTVYFLAASAVFRDGLAGVFTFGAVIAARAFDFSDSLVIVFAIVANVVAGIATIAAGRLDDRIGPKRIIVSSLVSMCLLGLVIFFLHAQGKVIFWVFGLALCIFVGPVQSASRTFLARVIPAGQEGQVFGLYATTGRAVSFLAPASFSIALWCGQQITGERLRDVQHWGILGIVVVLAVGLALLVPVRQRVNPDSALTRPGAAESSGPAAR